MRVSLTTLGALMALGGCASLSEPEPAGAVLTDTAVLSAAWTDRLQREAARFGPQTAATVWAGFDDADLEALVRAAVSQTPDIRAAQARIAQARAARALAVADGRPTVSTSGSATRERTSQAVQPPVPAGAGFEIDPETNAFSLGGSASWTPDIWGDVALRIRAADYDVASAEAAAQTVALGLEVETARTYISLRSAQQSLDILNQSIALLEENLSLTETLVDSELSPEFDAVQLRAEIATQRATLAQQESQLVTLGYALSALTGRAPRDVDTLLRDADGEVPDYQGGIRPGIPSTLLLRRPDLRSAAADLLAARDLEEAEALNRLPSFSLSGEAGFLSMTLDALISSDARRGLVSAAFDWPVYQGGRLQALRDQASAAEALATAEYDGAILTALRDVEQAFEAHISAERRGAALAEAVVQQERVVSLLELQFRSDLTDRFRVIEGQTALLTARLDRVEAQADEATAIIDIYSALGGDW